MGRGPIAVRNYESGLDRALLILGWGNDFDQPGIRWLVRKLNLYGLSVTAVRIPTDIRDYKVEIIDPVVALSRDMKGPILIAHSFGAVAGRYVLDSRKRIFSSPYWGVPEHRRIPLMAQTLSSLRWLSVPMFDRGYGPSDLGDMISDDDVDLIPQRISVRTIYQVWRAIGAMPDLSANDKVYYSKDDVIPDLGPILEAPCEKEDYAGGHQFFTCTSREKTMHDILYDLRSCRSA